MVEDSSIASGRLNAAIKRAYPQELLLLMRRQSVDLLLGNSNDRQGRSTLQFIKSIVEKRDDVEQLKKGMCCPVIGKFIKQKHQCMETYSVVKSKIVVTKTNGAFPRNAIPSRHR